MSISDHDNRRDEGSEDILRGLEQIARGLDGQAYPGQAWPIARGRPVRRATWKAAAMIVAAAAIAAVIVCHRPATRPPGERETTTESRPLVGVRTPAAEESPESAIPPVVMIEDLESYSLIDLTAGAPLGVLFDEGDVQPGVRGARPAGIVFDARERDIVTAGAFWKLLPWANELRRRLLKRLWRRGASPGNAKQAPEELSMNRMALLTIATVLAFAVNLSAGESPKAGAGKTEGKAGTAAVKVNQGPWAGKTAAQWYIGMTDKIVQLTDAQKKSITQIIEARDKAMKDFQTQNAAKLQAAAKAMFEAYQSKNKELIAKSQKVYQDLYAPIHELMKKSQADLNNLLTAEQRAKQQENRMTTWLKSLTDPAKLSDEQTKRARAAYVELAKKGDDTALWGKWPEMLKKILTPEQKATVFKHRRDVVYQDVVFQG